jgi:hypothetical protein
MASSAIFQEELRGRMRGLSSCPGMRRKPRVMKLIVWRAVVKMKRGRHLLELDLRLKTMEIERPRTMRMAVVRGLPLRVKLRDCM